MQHVSDVTNESWRKQECAVLAELAAMVSRISGRHTLSD